MACHKTDSGNEAQKWMRAAAYQELVRCFPVYACRLATTCLPPPACLWSLVACSPPPPSLDAVCLLLFALRSSTLAIGIFVAFTKVQREHWQLVARQCAADKSHEIITRVTVNAVKLSDPPPAPCPSPLPASSSPPCKMHS